MYAEHSSVLNGGRNLNALEVTSDNISKVF